MVQSSALKVVDYLAELSPERRKALGSVRRVIRKHLPKGYVEVMNWGMICYEIPLRTFPDTYNGKPLMYAALASQKRHMAVYLCSIYCMPGLKEKLLQGFELHGSKPDMGASCVRFRQVDQLPLETIGEIIASVSVEDYLANYASARS